MYRTTRHKWRIGLSQKSAERESLENEIDSESEFRSFTCIDGLRQLLGPWTRSGLISERTDLFDRADVDSVGSAQSAIDGASFCDSHLGSLDKETGLLGLGPFLRGRFART